MVLIPVYGKTRESLNLSDRYNLVWLEYWLINLTLFLTWANAVPLGHPWFFYPLVRHVYTFSHFALPLTSPLF